MKISPIKFPFTLYFLLVFCLISTSYSSAEEIQNKSEKNEPLALYEYGIGAGGFQIPLYPGSASTQERYIGLPYFVYRGKILKSDDDGGTRAELLKKKSYRIDMSFGGAFSADSSESEVRQGMPDLDFSFQLGPRLVYVFFKGTKELKVNVPLRSAFSQCLDGSSFKTIFCEESPVDRGILFAPNLVYSHQNLLWSKHELYLRMGATWASERFMEYLYEVPGAFANSRRPFYQAEEGLLETYFDIAMSQEFGEKFRMFLGYSYSDFRSAKNRKSPLHEQDYGVNVGIGMIWKLGESEERAEQWL